MGSVVYRPRDGEQTRLYVGQARRGWLHRPVQFLGWSVNLQGSPGANSHEFVEGVLAPWLRERMDLPPEGGETAT